MARGHCAYRSEHERWARISRAALTSCRWCSRRARRQSRSDSRGSPYAFRAIRAYGEQLLRGIEATTIPAELKIAACEKFFADDPIGYGDGIASALGHVGSELTDNVVSMLDFLAVTHPNPEKELWNVVPEGNSNPDRTAAKSTPLGSTRPEAGQSARFIVSWRPTRPICLGLSRHCGKPCTTRVLRLERACSACFGLWHFTTWKWPFRSCHLLTHRKRESGATPDWF